MKVKYRLPVEADQVVTIIWRYPDGTKLEEVRTAPPEPTKTARLQTEKEEK